MTVAEIITKQDEAPIKYRKIILTVSLFLYLHQAYL